MEDSSDYFFTPLRDDPYSDHHQHRPGTPTSSSGSIAQPPIHTHSISHYSPRSPRKLLTSTATPQHHSQQSLRSASSCESESSSAFRNYGLLLTLEKVAGMEGETQLCLQFCPDRNLNTIHPNAYAPTAFENVQKLGGGGSGVAVFAGHHPTLGDVVMKHGGDKDLVELFSLSNVAHELKTRCAGNEDAARHIQQRIPEFRMIYISPHHLGENRKCLWKRLRELRDSSFLLPVDEMETSSDDDSEANTNSNKRPSLMPLEEDEETEVDDELDASEAEEGFQNLKKISSLQSVMGKSKPSSSDLPPGVDISKSGTVSGHRDIAVMVAPQVTKCCANMEGDSLRIVVPEGQFDREEVCNGSSGGENEDENASHSTHDCKIRIHGDGYVALKAITDDLVKLMKSNRWKFTFGQKKIGGDHPKTGNEWLYEAKLSGPLLDNLVTQKIKLVRDLVSLTTDQEQSPKVLEQIREEMRQLRNKQLTLRKKWRADDVSDQADAYVGSAIKKNFRRETGRIPVLMKLGERFREHNQNWAQSFLRLEQARAGFHKKPSNAGPKLILMPEEEIPAYHLGCITKPEALIGNTFQEAPLEPTVLEALGSEYWQSLLLTAIQKPCDSNVNKEHSEMLWKRLWTCGLADAGLHNLFASIDKIWLFDLGEPTITSVPGFLTKFLFSFFHTLGMQERSDSGGGSDSGGMWVRRFEPNHKTKKLQLTADTSLLLAQAYKAFELSLDRIVAELFNGDNSVRWLLLQYVKLQIVSDASFCLQKWTVKGGGRARDRNHQEGLEKWLWRALWDIYVACDINSTSAQARLKVQEPPGALSNLTASAERMIQDRHMALIHELGFGVAPVQSHRDGFREERNSFQSFVNA